LGRELAHRGRGKAVGGRKGAVGRDVWEGRGIGRGRGRDPAPRRS